VNETALRRAWLAAVLALAAIIVIASLVPSAVVSPPTLSDKAMHYLAYFALALLGSGIAAPGMLWRTMLRCFLLGLGLEIAQALLTDQRSAEWADLVANATGILTAWLIAAQLPASWGLHAANWLLGRRPS